MYSKCYFDFIKNNPEKPWNWRWLSRNPSITWTIVQANPEKPWDWDSLSRNPMSLQKRMWAVEKIQEWWVEILYRPDSSYVVGKIRPRFEKLLRLFPNI